MNVLIIGFGSIGKRHYQILSEFKEVNNCHIVTKQKIQDKVTFSSIKKIDFDFYDYIIIASNTSLHYEQLKYIENQTKDKIILVEKPLFSKNKKLKIKNNKVYVAYNRRFYPIMKKIKNLVKKDKFYFINIHTGQYLPLWRPERDYRKTYSANKKDGGGVLLDLSHEIDYIQYLCGEMNIISSINTKISDLKIKSDDICTVLSKTTNGTLVNFTLDYISKEFIQNITIHLKNSSIYADLKNMKLKIVYKDSTLKMYDYSEFNKNYSFTKMHENILFKNKKNSCTYKEGLSVMRKISKIRELNYEK